jgi:iron complex outermembrane receptor protein
LNTALALSFGTAVTLWGGAATAQASTSPAAAGETKAALPAVTVKDSAEADGRVIGYSARRSRTGSKTDTPIIETPQSVSVVTADRIQAIGATTVRDALGYTPGINISPYGADSRYDWLNIRGFDAYSPGFYQDGLPLRNANTFAVWKIEPYGAERIDVLRGPASVLYGQASPGGVVDVVSKLPTSTPIRELQVQYGSHGHKQVAGDFAGALDAEGKLLYRVVGLVRDADLPQGGERNDRAYLAPSLQWKPSSDTSLTVYAQLMRNRAGVYTRTRPLVGSLVPTPIGSRIPSSLFVGNPNFDRFDHDQELAGYKFEHRLNETLMFRQSLRAGHMKLDYKGLQAPDFVALNPDNALDPANYRTLNRTLFGSREWANAFGIDNQLQADLRSGDWRHKLLFGIDYQRSRFESNSFSGGSAPVLDINAPAYPAAPFDIPDPYAIDSSRLRQTGFYAQDQIKWADRWQLTLGGRYDRARTDYFDRLGGETASTISDSKFTTRAGLVYLAPNGLAPYASYTESFNPITAINPTTQRPFEPETGRQYEAGLRYQPSGTRNMYSAAIFDLRRRNYVTFDPNFVPYQTGEISTRGIELEATTQPIPRMNLTAAYSYTQRAIVTASANPEQIGKQNTAVPRNQLALWTDYRLPGNVKVGVGARHTGWTRGNGGTTPVKVPSYTLVDALVGYDIEQWSLALNVRNLTNKTYLSNCDGTAQTCYYGDQRRVIATATYRW